MKAPSRGLARPLRCLILVATAGAVLAADNSWLTKLRFDFDDPVSWLSSFSTTKTPSPEPVALPVDPVRTATLSMDRLVNGRLYSQPATGWQLDGARLQFAPILMAQKASGPIVEVNGSTSPASSFSSASAAPSSSDLVRYSSAASPLVPNSPSATDGTWTSNASGNWGNSANWQSNVIADGAGNTAHFDVTNISSDVTVNLDTSRTIGNLYIGDTDATNHYTISPLSGSTLTFDPISTSFLDPSILQQRSTSAGDTIAANIFFKNDLQINNLSASHQFTISGNIASSGANGSSHSLGFNSSGAGGDILVSGNIRNGNTGATIFLGVDHGTVTLTGTNTYTGGTEVFGGTLLINGDNSAANGAFYVDNSGTLGGHGIIGSDVDVFGGKITGDTTTTVGTLTMNSLTFGGEVGGGTYIANLSGATSDLLAIIQTLTIFSGTGLQIVGSADNIHTYVLATFASRVGFNGGEFDPTLVTGIPSGYSLVYNATDIELVPTAIPEPATWIGGALALCAMALTQRRRVRALRSCWLSVIGS
jgi:autotransporter-associated beta strand protein